MENCKHFLCYLRTVSGINTIAMQRKLRRVWLYFLAMSFFSRVRKRPTAMLVKVDEAPRGISMTLILWFSTSLTYLSV